MPSLTKIVAENLRTTREQRNLSQQSLARRAGVCISYVSMLERGVRTPPLDTVEALAKALGVKPLALLTEATRGRRRPGPRAA